MKYILIMMLLLFSANGNNVTECMDGNGLSCYKAAEDYSKTLKSQKVDSFSSSDIKIIKGFFEKACELKHGKSCFNISNGYYRGRFGEVNEKKTKEYLLKSCSSSFGPGCQKIGAGYYRGLFGFEKDMSKSMSFFEKGCELDDAYSCFFSSRQYVAGNAKNKEKAMFFLVKACMLNKKLTLIFFIIILIEGFFTLSLELLVIRQTIPFVGNGTEMVSIIISSVLLPLSIGYYYGGKRYSELFKKNKKTKIRNILIKNIYIIVLLSGIGFSYISIYYYFKVFSSYNLMLLLSTYLLIFLSIPTFFLGQTVPLLSNYFSSKEMSKITGKILFLSTAGSFAGSVITVLISMRFIGVSNTLIVIEFILLMLILLISKDKVKSSFLILFIMILMINLKSLSISVFDIEYDNRYNTVSIIEKKDATFININNSNSSKTNKDNSSFYPYVNIINKYIEKDKNKDILIVGAGGFTIGFNDEKNNYTYVDIDSDLKNIVEEKFLKEKLKNNKIYKAGEIRRFLIENNKKYELLGDSGACSYLDDQKENLDKLP